MIHIATVVHNRRKLTEQFVRCIQMQSTKDIHLIVVDDGSTDGTSDMILQLCSKATVLKGDGNLWWGGGLHMIFKWIKNNQDQLINDYLLLTNDDVIYGEEYLSKGIAHLQSLKKGMVLGRGYSISSGQIIDSVLHLDYKRPWNESVYVISKDNVGECSSTRSLFMSVRTFLDVGGFHPILLPHYGADYEWTIRASRKGHMIHVFDDLVYTCDEHTTGDNSYEDLTLGKAISKRSNTNPIYRFNLIFLSTPIRYLPSELMKQVARYISKISIFTRMLKRGNNKKAKEKN